MKWFDKLFATILALILAIFLCSNIFLQGSSSPSGGKPYRVEVNRLVQQMESGEKPDLSDCDYITAVTQYAGDIERFYNTGSDYLIREVNGEVYRFDYTQGTADSTHIIVLNTALGAISIIIIIILLVVRQKLLRPFEKLQEVPYELSKGNLTIPIHESKSRLFGRFVWGVNMLRESMETQKQREQELQKEKKTLLLSLSHDIKTPLSAIKLYSKALSRGLYADEEKQRQIASSIDDKADEIEAYVSQIVQASSEDFLSLEVSQGEFYLSELVDQITLYYKDKLSLIKTSFTILPYTNCMIRGDLDRSVEVIQNLMENAIKYGDGKSIDLSLSEEDGCILIGVCNSGCTLPSGELPHIFDSFWRGSNAHKQKGSGLGLYICRQLMRKMGGDIFAEIIDRRMIVTAVFPKA